MAIVVGIFPRAVDSSKIMHSEIVMAEKINAGTYFEAPLKPPLLYLRGQRCPVGIIQIVCTTHTERQIWTQIGAQTQNIAKPYAERGDNGDCKPRRR